MKLIALLIGIVSVIFVGCNDGQKKELSSEEGVEVVDATLVDSHNSENSLDWAGVYSGTTPCADCEGIKTILELKADKTYKLSQTYLGKLEGNNEFEQMGNFQLDDSNSNLLLKTKNDTLRFKVGENQLLMLNKNGKMIDGKMSDLYILKKNTE